LQCLLTLRSWYALERNSAETAADATANEPTFHALLLLHFSGAPLAASDPVHASGRPCLHRAVGFLFALGADHPEVARSIERLPRAVKQAPALALALEAHNAEADGNYVRFFRLWR
jgi:hypothetical protein